MRTTTPGALGLLALILAGCSAGQVDQTDGAPSFSVDGATAISLASGAVIEDCTDALGEAWCADDDFDGYVDADVTDPFGVYGGCVCITAGTLPADWTEVMSSASMMIDCDDTDATITAADMAVYADDDLDGYGAGGATLVCDGVELEVGTVDNDGDCDDTDGAINPDALEICDSLDNDCDDLVDDEDDSVDASTGMESWPDADSDGYGDMDGESEWSCALPDGYVEDATDCDDGDSTVYPGAEEILDDGVDQDCDGVDAVTSATDADGDGYDSVESGGDDCNDTNADVNPGAEEIAFNGLDDDCDGEELIVAYDSEICVTPIEELMDVAWGLYVRNKTVDPDGDLTDTWSTPVVEGTGTLCFTGDMINGDVEAFNGLFSTGVYLYELDATNASTVTGNGYLLTVVNTAWGVGADGLWHIDTL